MTDPAYTNNEEMLHRMADDPDLRADALALFRKASRYRYSYNFTWLGRPIIQFPQDIVAMQELIWRIKPDLIVETGIAHGGSLIFWASMMQLLGGDGQVIGIDIEIRPPNREELEKHPLFSRITLIEGSSVDPKVANRVRDLARGRERVMVVLDSNHTHDHVLKELELYSTLVRKGSYLVVFDTIVQDMPEEFSAGRPWGKGNNPKTALRDFLKQNDRFEVDAEIESKLLLTVAPGGYLRCVRDAAEASPPPALPQRRMESTGPHPALPHWARESTGQRIPVAGPWITEREIGYVAEAARTAWYANANTYQRRFEVAFAAYLQRRYAIALPSCTAAIHLALLAIDVGPHDEVVVPEATWIASGAPISYVGATPVFADIDPQTWCLSPESFERAITPRTRAVIPVNLYGGMPDYQRILEIADRHRIVVIEDAAESIGSIYHGTKAGGFGLASVFSFHGSKTVTTGEGGILLTDDETLYQRCRILADHGRRPQDRAFWNAEIGQKYKMSSLQAALGLAQLERVEELVGRKREIFSWYRSALSDARGLQLNAEPEETRNSYWMVTALVDGWWGVTKERLGSMLANDRIDTRPFFYPLSSLPAYTGSPQAGVAAQQNHVAYDVCARGINLPSALNLTREQVEYVADRLMAALESRAAA